MSRKNTLLLIYNSFNDPLFQNLILEYIKTLSQNTKDGMYHLVTFEQSEFKVAASDIPSIKKELVQYRIDWHPLQFHSGRFLLLKKAWDFINAFFLVLLLRVRYKLNILFCFANVSAAMGVVLAKVLRMKMIVYSYEPHSEFQVELGLWKKNGLKYKVMSRLEQLAGLHADYILTGTRHMVERLQVLGSKAKIFRAPTAVDENQFQFNVSKRLEIRRELKLEKRKVFIYPGKFEGLYYSPEVFVTLCNQIKSLFEDAFFLVATNFDLEILEEEFQAQGLSKDSFLLRPFVPMNEMPSYLAASDMGIVAIPPTPAQKFRSPTKVAEFLLCGLPYIVSRGISEDDEVARTEGVGVEVEGFDIRFSKEVIEKLNNLFSTSPDKLREKCRIVGLEYRSKERIDKLLLEIYQNEG
ncbi:hypothetical protein [Ekhidna sp.]|uniref:hypothetical protein n=1 Tax=Ekhidna sp. TaxID=2608089 RepID=UPI003516C08D